jgi:hypothetical protein
MTIQNGIDYDQALSQIKNWLTKEEYSKTSFHEIESIIVAVEKYTGMPLPAKNFILQNCLSSN